MPVCSVRESVWVWLVLESVPVCSVFVFPVAVPALILGIEPEVLEPGLALLELVQALVPVWEPVLALVLEWVLVLVLVLVLEPVLELVLELVLGLVLVLVLEPVLEPVLELVLVLALALEQ